MGLGFQFATGKSTTLYHDGLTDPNTGLAGPPYYSTRGLPESTPSANPTFIPSSFHNEVLFRRDDNLKKVQPQDCLLAGFGNADPPEECCVNLSGPDWRAGTFGRETGLQ